MGTKRVRFLGGLLHGKVLWVEENCGSLDVKVAGGGGVPRTLRYLRDGAKALFRAEPATALGRDDATPAPA